MTNELHATRVDSAPAHSASGFNRRKLIMNTAVSLASLASAIALAPAPAHTQVAPVMTPSTAPTPHDITQTKIEKLWVNLSAFYKEYSEAEKASRKLERKLALLMPKPDRSIVYGVPENDADGLKYPGVREPHTLHHYIWSGEIERKLKAVGPDYVKVKKSHGRKVITMFDKPLGMSKNALALRDRLAARLKLSQSYERKIARLKKKIGLRQVEDKLDKLIDQQDALEHLIISSPASARCDFAIKLAIVKRFDGTYGTDEVLRDMQRLVDAPSAFAKAWAFDPNAPVAAPVEA